MKIRFLVLSLLVYTNILFPSIISGTFLKTYDGYKTVENITIGDSLVSYHDDCLTTTTVTHISKTTTDTLIVITTEKGSILSVPDQQFFDPILEKWIAAKELTTKNTFLDAQLNHCACLNVQIINISKTIIYHISTTDPHNFFATEQELLVHNAFPIVIGFAWLFGGGLKFAGVTIGTAVLGSYVGVQLYNAQKQKNQKGTIFLQVIGSSPCPDPNDNENERKFNTISKSEFFRKVKNDYEHYKNGIYRRKKGAKGIEKAEYLEWDHLHGDVEAYAKGGRHLGSIDPQTLRIYKGPVIRNISI